MITVNEAKNIIRHNCKVLPAITLPLESALTYVLAEDVYAVADIPAFDQSSMDGYAIAFDDYYYHHKLQVEGVIPAGHSIAARIQARQAARIFTGAPMPQGADTVIIQEKVTVENNELTGTDTLLKKGSNVRPKGSEIKAGEIAATKGTCLSPAAIGFLAGIGIAEVKVISKPTISIVVTGNELRQPGKPLLHGQVYESNSFTLNAILQQLFMSNVTTIWVDDDLCLMEDALEKALEHSDMVLLTGGVSVGDYDYVLEAASICGVQQLFHRIKQKPGKPLFFGKKGDKLVFGLPGNPSSVLTCFYEYVIPALQQLTQRKSIIKVVHLPLAKAHQKKPGLTHFLKGHVEANKVIPLQAQESYRLSSFSAANCLIRLEEEGEEYAAGAMVEVHLLPF
ncbi:molybdopterin molybdochelatase [Russula earlei]|uniref:Molybdopterin molybdochelatase n=1 Tax=Russula earlei TaxID=71964 RepID=A0ACC0TVW8_9AGAM|nr:molybdopterin molybdochelatase [Russula earlei]